MVTVIEFAPGVNPVGTVALIWYRPGKPGARPQKSLEAGLPPIITTGFALQFDTGFDRAGSPLAGRLCTGPRAVAKSRTGCPGRPGLPARKGPVFAAGRRTAPPP